MLCAYSAYLPVTNNLSSRLFSNVDLCLSAKKESEVKNVYNVASTCAANSPICPTVELSFFLSISISTFSSWRRILCPSDIEFSVN